MKLNKNLFLRSNDLWYEMSKSINFYEEMIIISPFIDRKQLKELQKIIESWDFEKNFQLKILTTTFDGKMKYLDIEGLKNFIQLIKDNYPNIKIQLKIEDARQNRKNRLHAKAYLFRNEKLSEVVYNGSSNFTYTGMNTAEEWNIKLIQTKEPDLCREIDNNFDLLWNTKKCYDFNKNEKILDCLLNYKKSIENIQKKLNESDESKNITEVINSYPYAENKIKKKLNFEDKNFFPKNNWEMKDRLFLQFAILNNEYLIDSFIKIIDYKKLTEDDVVNNLFIASFIAGELNLRSSKELNCFLNEKNYHELEDIIFDVKYSKLLNEIKKLLDNNKSKNYLIKNNNLRHTFLTYQQCKAVAYHANYKDYKNWNLWRTSGVELSHTKNSKIALFTDENSPHSKSKYKLSRWVWAQRRIGYFSLICSKYLKNKWES